MESTDLNVRERLEALVARRELRNPGLTKVRQRNIKTVKWDDLIVTPVRKMFSRNVA